MRQNDACGNLVTFIHNWQVLGGLFSAHVVVGRRWMNQRGRWMRHVRWHWYRIVIFLKSITKRLIEWYVRVEEWWRFKYMKRISWNRRWQTMNGKIMQMSWWWWVSSVLFALVAVWLLVDTAGWRLSQIFAVDVGVEREVDPIASLSIVMGWRQMKFQFQNGNDVKAITRSLANKFETK